MEHVEVMYLGLCGLTEWTLFCILVKKLEWFEMVEIRMFYNGVH